MIKKRILRYSLALAVFGLSLTLQDVFAQDTKAIINTSLIGKVIDAVSKEPLEGVTIQLDGVTHNAKTDREGNFQFVTGQKLPFKIRVSFVGYVSKEVVISLLPAVIELEPSTEELDEVVVVGYGTQRKRDLTGASTNINFTEDISGRPSRETFPWYWNQHVLLMTLAE